MHCQLKIYDTRKETRTYEQEEDQVMQSCLSEEVIKKRRQSAW
jgi:hypothetical protein